MRCKNNSKAFTLIEVLIALVILAVALTAVIVTISDSVKNISRLDERMASHWVAMNVMAELQTGMQKLPPNQTDVIRGQEKMLGHRFYWEYSRVQGVNQSSNKVYQRVFVNVYLDKNRQRRLEHLIGFVRLPDEAITAS